jgi:voltage-dependent potassium channel beta subunit
MLYRHLGNSGLQVSVLSFGTWLTFGAQIDDDTAEKLMILAYDKGVNFFDNAEIYAEGKSELVMGKLLKKLQWDRTSYLVSSKVYFGDHRRGPNQTGLSRKHVVEACHSALKRLQVDYLDMFFCHRSDKDTPIAETVWTMHQLIMQGKILYWGTPEWSAQEITAAHLVAAQYGLIGPTMEQPQYNMFHRQRVEVEYEKLYKDFGMGTTIWSPLASGVLTGKYNKEFKGKSRLTDEKLTWLSERSLTEDRLDKARKLEGLANELGISMTALSLAWCLRPEFVSTVILGASKTVHLEENIQAIDALPLLTDDVMERIEIILDNRPNRSIW